MATTTRSIVSSALVGDDSGAIPGRCYSRLWAAFLLRVILWVDMTHRMYLLKRYGKYSAS